MAWISVKKQLPEEDESVDVFTKEDWRVCSVKFSKGKFEKYIFDHDDNFFDMEEIKNVTHWSKYPDFPDDED